MSLRIFFGVHLQQRAILLRYGQENLLPLESMNDNNKSSIDSSNNSISGAPGPQNQPPAKAAAALPLPPPPPPATSSINETVSISTTLEQSLPLTKKPTRLSIEQQQHRDDERRYASSQYRELFPATTRDFVTGMTFVPRQTFYDTFDVGYGLDKETPRNKDVLLLYQSEAALPNDSSTNNNMDAALANCDSVQVVMVDPKPTKGPKAKKDHKQCVAIMGQWESRHVHRFRRRKQQRQQQQTKTAKITASNIQQLQQSSQFQYQKHHHQDLPPSKEDRDASQRALLSYLSVLDDGLERLKPIAKAASLGKGNNNNNNNNNATKDPIIVMVANYGQMELFVNFVCTAKARGLSEALSRVLLFATDLETYTLAQHMGQIHVFYDERIFGDMPKQAAVDYHDSNYGHIMMSKVYSVHMVNALGYDLLFQDVDLVWYQNPLNFFAKQSQPPNANENDDDSTNYYDMTFQHDGAHHPQRFKPLAANTGFYFVRYNARTEYFFSVFVRMGELVLAEKSHQAAMTTLVNEHMALWGLRIKVLADNEDSRLFLSGYHFHANKQAIRSAMVGHYTPILYHVNWMEGAVKKPALIESNNWFVTDQCFVEESLSITTTIEGSFADQCCRATAAPNDRKKPVPS